MPDQLYLPHAKTRVSAEEEKESTKARVPEPDGHAYRTEGAEAEKAHRKEETHRLEIYEYSSLHRDISERTGGWLHGHCTVAAGVRDVGRND